MSRASGDRPLRVALDVSMVDRLTLGSGIYRYAVDLVNGLAAADADIELLLLGSVARPPSDFQVASDRPSDRCRWVCLPPYSGRGYYYRDVARLSWWLATRRVDVFHEVHTNFPPLKPCPVVVTVYHHYYHAGVFDSRPHRYYRWALRHRTDLVITISDATRDDYHALYQIPLERMRTVYLGLSPSLTAVGGARGGRRYVLSPYNLSPPKNLGALIRAWPAIAERHPDLELILFGRAFVTPENESEFEALVRSLPHTDGIRRVGYVSDAELAGLYAGCELFIFPTTLEGFGYPLLEAMTQGACCITRNASSMKEIGGDAVCLVETLQPTEIAEAAIELLADEPRRRSMGERGKRRASEFTVDRMIQKTLDCYYFVAGRRGKGTAPVRAPVP